MKQLATENSLKPIENDLETIWSANQIVASTASFIQAREEIHEKTLEKIEANVKRAYLLKIVIVAIVFWMQVYLIKLYFSQK